MCQDVDKTAEKVAHIESAYAPRLLGGAVLKTMASRHRTLEDIVQVVDFDRDIRNRRV